MFSFIDILIIVITLLYVIFGYQTGFLKATGRVLAFIGGVALFFLIGDFVATFFVLVLRITLASATFGVFVAIMIVSYLIGWGISAALGKFEDFESTIINGLLGSVLGLVRSVFLFCTLCVFGAFGVSLGYEESWASSRLLPYYGAVLKTSLPKFSAGGGNGLAKHIHEMTYNKHNNRPYLSILEYEHEPEEEEPSQSEQLQQLIEDERAT